MGVHIKNNEGGIMWRGFVHLGIESTGGLLTTGQYTYSYIHTYTLH